MLPDEHLGGLEHFMTTVSKCGHVFRAYDDALDFVARRRDADRRAAKLEQLFPLGAADPGLLGLLKVPLYPYQAKARCSGYEQAVHLSATIWDWARPSRQSPQLRYWRGILRSPKYW